MKRCLFVFWTAWVALVSLDGLAEAVTKHTEFCFRWETEYTDGATGDFWTAIGSTVRPASGVYFQLIRRDGLMMHNDFIDSSTNYSEWFVVSTDYSYTVKMFAKGAVPPDDNVVWVRLDDVNYGPLFATFTFQPGALDPAYGIRYFTYSLDGVRNESNMIAAAGLALNRRDDGFVGQWWYMYTSGSSTGGDNHVHIGQSDRAYKFLIVHELGHNVAYRKNLNEGPILDCTFRTGQGEPCDSGDGNRHSIDSEEFQTCAAGEGFAHYYSATVWNDSSETDCEYYYKYADPNVWDCSTGANRLETVCDESPTDTTKGCELDWLRQWWDLETGANVSFDDIMEIWDDSDPEDWAESTVYRGLRNAALANGVSSGIWDNLAAMNGVDHGI